MDARRGGKTLLAIEMTKAAQKAGKSILWFTYDQAVTANTLAKHGALSEVVGTMYLKPRFRECESR
ncbi:hypothetical protein [Pseudooceanicola nanhaiensis]|uniref:hypothetical protein n=1 Tax=Pseudooceanicola nanhaiensis TaxID=375761 RepID=UPI003517138C